MADTPREIQTIYFSRVGWAWPTFFCEPRLEWWAMPPYKTGASSIPKEVQMSVKMEPELRDQFMAVAASRRRPAAQIIRDLMRLYIAQSETPNELTAAYPP
jgi:hypothetical protein